MQKCKYRSSHIIKQERDVGRIEEPILFKEKLLAVLCSGQLHQLRSFPTYFFQWIFRVPVLFNKCFEKVLKNYTVNFLSLRLEKHQNAISMCSAKGKKRALQRECFEKGSRKTVMSESWFSNITIWLYQNETPPRTVSKIYANFLFGKAVSQNSSEQLDLRNLYLFSMSNHCCRKAM